MNKTLYYSDTLRNVLLTTLSTSRLIFTYYQGKPIIFNKVLLQDLNITIKHNGTDREPTYYTSMLPMTTALF